MELKKGLQVSKNFVIKKRIINPVELFKLKTVYVKSWGKMHPAAWMCSMQFRTLCKFIRSGIYECERIN